MHYPFLSTTRISSIYMTTGRDIRLPLCALHSHLLLLNSSSSSPMTLSEARGAPDPTGGAHLSFSSFKNLEELIRRTFLRRTFKNLSHKENLCKKILDSEVSLGEGREAKCDGITLQFLLALSCCQIAVPSAEYPAQCSTEQLHLPQNATGLLCVPEMAVLPISPAESSAIEHVRTCFQVLL